MTQDSWRPLVEYTGAYRTAAWLPDSSGNFRGREYYLGLSVRERARLQALIERVCDVKEGIRDKTKFRHEEDGIWVFKRYQERLFCFMDGRLILITHGLRKKQDRVLRSDLATAQRIRDLYLARRSPS